MHDSVWQQLLSSREKKRSCVSETQSQFPPLVFLHIYISISMDSEIWHSSIMEAPSPNLQDFTGATANMVPGTYSTHSVVLCSPCVSRLKLSNTVVVKLLYIKPYTIGQRNIQEEIQATLNGGTYLKIDLFTLYKKFNIV